MSEKVRECHSLVIHFSATLLEPEERQAEGTEQGLSINSNLTRIPGLHFFHVGVAQWLK